MLTGQLHVKADRPAMLSLTVDGKEIDCCAIYEDVDHYFGDVYRPALTNAPSANCAGATMSSASSLPSRD